MADAVPAPDPKPEPPNSADDITSSISSDVVAQTASRNGFLFRLNSKIDRTMRRLFYKLGRFVSHHPRRTMLVAVLFTLVSLAGMARYRTEFRAEELWVPQGTEALRNKEYVDARYPDEFRVANLIFLRRGDTEGGNVVTKTGLLEMVDAIALGEKVRIDSGGLAQRCSFATDSEGNRVCRSNSVLSFFYDATSAVKTGDIVDFPATVRRRIDSLDENEIKNIIATRTFTGIDGTPLEREDYIGNITGSGNGLEAEAFFYQLILKNNLTLENGREVDNDAQDWEEQWTTTLLDAAEDSSKELVWRVDSFWGQIDSLDQVLTQDLPLLSGGFALLFLFVVFFLGDFHAVRSRKICGMIGLATAGLALGTMFGLSSLFGMFYGPVHGFIPFLILGIACDDIFIVTRTLNNINRDERYSGKSSEQRVAYALSEAGTAITVTSFTNTLVFLIGSITKLPSLRFFSLWAAIGIFFAWVYTITFYTAYLTIDQKRMDAGRYDMFPCKKASTIKETNWFGRKPGVFSRFMGNSFGPFIMRKPVAIILLIIILALFGVSVWGTTRLYRKFRFSFFYSEGTSQFEFQEAKDRHFPDKQGTNIYIRDIDYTSESNQQKLFDLCREGGLVARDPTIVPESVECWYEYFRRSQDVTTGVVPRDTFIQDLRTFLNSTDGKRFDEDVIFRNGKIETSRFSAEHIPLFSNSDEVDAMESLRRTVREANIGQNGEDAFPYTFGYLFYEQYAALPREIAIALGLSLVAVVLVSLVLIGHPIVALVAVVSVTMILVDLLGFLNFTDINVNSVSVINLVIGTGLAVDAVAHICRGFLENIGDRKTRSIHALRDLGQPVFYASFSTFLAIVLLAGAKSYVFQVFFKLFAILIFAGLIHGLLFAPIVLRFIGPRGFYETKEEKEADLRDLEKTYGEGTGTSGSEEEVSEAVEDTQPEPVTEEKV